LTIDPRILLEVAEEGCPPLCSHPSSVLPISDPGAFPETKSLWQTF